MRPWFLVLLRFARSARYRFDLFRFSPHVLEVEMIQNIQDPSQGELLTHMDMLECLPRLCGLAGKWNASAGQEVERPRNEPDTVQPISLH